MKKSVFIILGVLLLLGTYLGGYIHSWSQYIPPHFHANFLMYINGEQVDFSGDQFMEDVAGCSLTWKLYPKDRAHLHENNGETIHIHDDWVAWWHFFANNDFVFSENFISSNDSKVYINSWDRRLKFILNGEEISNPYNKLIESQDRLLIIYGTQTDEESMKIFQTVSTNAWEYNSKYDPGSCWGTNENGIKAILREFIHKFHSMDH